MSVPYSLFDTLLEPVFVLDAEQRVVYCNEPAAVVADISARKMSRGMKFKEIFEFSDTIDGLETLAQVTDPTPYKEINFKNNSGTEGKFQVTLQPLQTEDGVPHWLVFTRDVTLEERLQKKYRAELEKKEDVIKALEDAKIQLENYSKNLEKMVAERTHELSRLNQMMTALLDSLQQGFFVFDPQGLVLDISSKACENTVECRPQGRNIWDVLKLPENKVEGFKKWMMTVAMEMLPFEDLAPLGPASYPHSQGRNIALEYFPLRSQSGTIEGVVVVASDITSLVEAQKQAEMQKEHAKLIINLVQSKREISRFIRETQGMLQEMGPLLDVPVGNLDSETLFRLLHTIKGGAALFSVQKLTENAHHAESLVAELKDNPQAAVFDNLKLQCATVGTAFTDFLQQAQDILGSSVMSEDRQIEVPFSKLQSVVDRMRAFPQGQAMADVILSELVMEPIASFFRPYGEVVHQVAEKLEKQIAPLEFKNPDLMVLPEAYSGLFASFVHAYRNAVDHGIEAPATRELNGKDPQGHIVTSFSFRPEKNHLYLCITVTDDGQGINADKLRQRLVEKGLTQAATLSEHDLFQHIFDSSVSTREQITEISGRGVGMDAIKHAAEDLQGRAWVESISGKGTTLHVEVPYTTELSRPVRRPHAA